MNFFDFFLHILELSLSNVKNVMNEPATWANCVSRRHFYLIVSVFTDSYISMKLERICLIELIESNKLIEPIKLTRVLQKSRFLT